jgi:hypothetical protein
MSDSQALAQLDLGYPDLRLVSNELYPDSADEQYSGKFSPIVPEQNDNYPVIEPLSRQTSTEVYQAQPTNDYFAEYTHREYDNQEYDAAIVLSLLPEMIQSREAPPQEGLVHDPAAYAAMENLLNCTCRGSGCQVCWPNYSCLDTMLPSEWGYYWDTLGFKSPSDALQCADITREVISNYTQLGFQTMDNADAWVKSEINPRFSRNHK